MSNHHVARHQTPRFKRRNTKIQTMNYKDSDDEKAGFKRQKAKDRALKRQGSDDKQPSF